MRSMHLSMALAALVALFLPCAAHGEFIYCDTYAFYDQWTYEVYGFSRTWEYYFEDPLAVESTLFSPSYTVLSDDWDITYESSWTQAWVSRVLLSGDQFNAYYWIRGQHWHYDWEWEEWTQLPDTWQGVYATYSPVPSGEVTSPDGWNSGDPLVAAYHADLYPWSTLYDQHYVWEVFLSNTTDTCVAQWPYYGSWPDPTPGYWVVGGSTYGTDWIGTDRDYVDSFTFLINAEQISPCGWSIAQGMFFGAVLPQDPYNGYYYSSSTIGMTLDGDNAISTRGGVDQYYHIQ
jgi:hypothetical protein